MATTIQVRRGTTAQVDAVTPASGEPIWETDGLKLAIGDGATAGGKHVAMGDIGDYVAKSLFDAYTILMATTDNTPLALSVTEQTLVGRKTSGAIAALSGADALLAMGITPLVAELNFVDGVTSAIQTQMDLKSPIASPTFTGIVTLPTGSLTVAPLKFVSGVVLTTPVAGVMEFVADTLSFTITTGAARKTVAFLESPSFTTPSLGVATATSINALTLTAVAVGFTIAGGTTSKTLTVPLDASVSGTNTGDNTIATSGDSATAFFSSGILEVAIGGTGVAASTGTVAVVLSNSPTLVTPILGVASATSLATSAAIPLLLTYGQLVNIALTSQTVGATTLTIPNFASVSDTFVFTTLAQELGNKTLNASVLKGTFTASGAAVFPDITIGGLVITYAGGIVDLSHIATTGFVQFRGGTAAAGKGAYIFLTGSTYGLVGAFIIYTPNSALTADVERLRITGGVTDAVATWASITHTGIKLTGAANAFGAYVLATGAGKTVDNVITALQALGLVTQT